MTDSRKKMYDYVAQFKTRGEALAKAHKLTITRDVNMNKYKSLKTLKAKRKYWEVAADCQLKINWICFEHKISSFDLDNYEKSKRPF